MSQTLKSGIGWFNVKAYGAKGDGITDDTTAVQAAITAASSSTAILNSYGRGAVVFLPKGIYKVTSTLTAAPGVGIQGSGRRTTQILIVHPDATTDGLVWNSALQYGDAGFLRDIAVMADATTHVHDVVVLTNWGPFEVANCDIGNAGRYGLYMLDGIDTTIRDTLLTSNTSAGAWVGDLIRSITTTTRFVRVYASNTTNGPGLDLAGLQINVTDCVLESNGVNDKTNGVGIRVRSGTVVIVSPYFENNAGWGMSLGTTAQAHVTVINPSFQTGPYSVAANGGILADQVSGGAFIGGDYSALRHTIKFTSNASQVSVVGIKNGPNVPEYNVPSKQSINDYPGLVEYTDPATGQRRLTGQYAMYQRLNGIGATITQGLSLSNNIAAAAGAQQWSPGLEWIGQGWGTGSAASQQQKMAFALVPVQSTNAGLRLGLFPSQNGAAYPSTPVAYFDQSGAFYGNAGSTVDTSTAGNFVAAGAIAKQWYIGGSGIGGGGGTLDSGSGTINFKSASTQRWQINSGALQPSDDNSYAIGTTGLRATNVFSMRHTFGTQAVAAAASLTIAPSSGGKIRINLSATAMTSLTISAGNNGEFLYVVIAQDGTGGRTIPTTWTNVKFAGGTYTASAGASKIDVLQFVYDSTAAAWLEVSRALNM